MTACWAVVPAAGSGSRLSAARRKQFLELEGRSLLSWSLHALLDAVPLEGIAVALPAGAALPAAERSDPRIQSCTGGASRAESVAAGLAALPAAGEDWVLVHDAARPCVPATDIRRLVRSVIESGQGAILAQPLADTLKRADERARVVETVDRSALWRALTPQMFRVGELRDALAEAMAAGASITDEASAMEFAGHPVQLIEGSTANIKVTYPGDLPLAAFWLARQKEAA